MLKTLIKNAPYYAVVANPQLDLALHTIAVAMSLIDKGGKVIMVLPAKYFDQNSKADLISAIGAIVRKKIFAGIWSPGTRLLKKRKGIDYAIFE